MLPLGRKEKQLFRHTNWSETFDFLEGPTHGPAQQKKEVILQGQLDCSWDEKKSVVRRMRASFSAILSGLSDTSLAIIFYILGIVPSSRYFFNMIMHAMTKAIIEDAIRTLIKDGNAKTQKI